MEISVIILDAAHDNGLIMYDVSLGYICIRGSKYIKLLKYFAEFFKFLKLSNISVPYNMGQTTFIFEKSE